MLRNGLVLLATLTLGLGCAADPSKTSSGNRSGDEASAGTGSSGGAGTESSSFGNSDAAVSSDGLATGDAGTCEVGKFCAPSQVDPTDDCGSLTVKSDVKEIKKPGNVLVIFDRSGSMDQDWGGVPKYQSAGNALIAALTPLQDLLTVGGVFFPSLDTAAAGGCMCNPADFTQWLPGGCCLMGSSNSCVVTTIDQPDQINFGPAADFITNLPTQWRLQGAAGTPTQQGVQRGAEALAGKTFTDPVVVVLLTDGQPNCGTDSQMVLDQVKAWHDAGITTHVVGLPGAQGAADLLNQLAAAGGSGMYIDPADPKELETRLSAVFTSTIKAGFDSCTMHLDPPADAPEKLHLVATQNGMQQDVPRDLSADASWTINAAGDTVKLQGQLCSMAKDGTFEALTFKYGCVDLPPLPPPEPPM